MRRLPTAVIPFILCTLLERMVSNGGLNQSEEPTGNLPSEPRTHRAFGSTVGSEKLWFNGVGKAVDFGEHLGSLSSMLASPLPPSSCHFATPRVV